MSPRFLAVRSSEILTLYVPIEHSVATSRSILISVVISTFWFSLVFADGTASVS